MKHKSKKIIIDEEAEALRLLANGEKTFNVKSITILSKYYFSLGLKPSNVKKNIIEYLCKFNILFELDYEDVIDKIIFKNRYVSMKRADVVISITTSEMLLLKKLPHKDYLIALYALFIAKLEKLQILKKRNINKLKSFKTFLNHDLKSCAYNVGVNLSELESMKLSNRLYVANILEPTFTGSYILKCADYDSKDLSMVIEGKKDFVSQVKYYCIECGNETEKSKRHDYCKSCYSVKRRVYKTEKQRKYRQSQ